MSSSSAAARAELAPIKENPKEKSVLTPKKQISKKNGKLAVKRPARGYHRFRNGILNVAPKKGEKEMQVLMALLVALLLKSP
jgi:hypothetical protein